MAQNQWAVPCAALRMVDEKPKVRYWCNYTILLELTLSKIVENYLSRSYPYPAFGGKQAGKNSPPDPLSFCPPADGHRIFLGGYSLLPRPPMRER